MRTNSESAVFDKIPKKTFAQLCCSVFVALAALLVLIISGRASAITPIPTPKPKPGSYGLEATKPKPAPKTPPSITTPGNGASFSKSPTTINGICTKDLLVEIFNNDVFVGSVKCNNGSFTIKVSLFTGKNVLKAIQYDELDQASPASSQISINYNNSSFASLGGISIGQFITLTSSYGRRAANPGDTLFWPLQLSGGAGPYAFSIDWGGNTPSSLKSVSLAGNVTINHVYSHSGIYSVTIRVTDNNGVSAFLQVVAVANGKPTKGASTSNSKNAKDTTVVTKVLWVPVLIILLLLIPAFWLGRRSELVSVHRQLENDMEKYKEK